MPAKPGAVGEYLATVTGPNRSALETLVKRIRAAAPDAVEGVSYGMPAFLVDGKGVAAFLAAAGHLSYFPMSGRVVAALADELKGFSTSKGTIRFTPEKPLPAKLVKKLVHARLAELRGAKPKGKSSITDPAVEQFLKELDHPLTADYVAVRKLILGIDPSIGEGIKWNAPSFRTADYFATLFLRKRDAVQFIFHTGAKAKGLNLKDKKIPDPDGLVEWLAKDRCMVTLGAGKELKANRKEFEAFVRAWISHLPG
jgi:uncharacterized protein YdhG (YjbR/CyaY superfamily)